MDTAASGVHSPRYYTTDLLVGPPWGYLVIGNSWMRGLSACACGPIKSCVRVAWAQPRLHGPALAALYTDSERYVQNSIVVRKPAADWRIIG